MKYVIYIPEESDTTGFKHYGNENSGRYKRGTGVQPDQALKRAHIIPWGENFRNAMNKLKEREPRTALGKSIDGYRLKNQISNEREKADQKYYDEYLSKIYHASDEEREKMVKDVRLKQLGLVVLSGNDSITHEKSLRVGANTVKGMWMKDDLIKYINHPDKDPINQRAMKIKEANNAGKHYEMSAKEIKEDREFARSAIKSEGFVKGFNDLKANNPKALKSMMPNTPMGRVKDMNDAIKTAKANSEKLDRIPKPTLMDKAKEVLSSKSANRQNSTSEDVKATYNKMQQNYEKQQARFKDVDEMYRKIDKDYEKVSAALSKNPNVKGMYPVTFDRAKTDGKPILYLDSDYITSDADYKEAAREWEKLGYHVEKL